MNISRIGQTRSTSRRPVSVSVPTELGRDAARLLTALDAEGAYALADPLTEGDIIVRNGGDGISVSRGRYLAQGRSDPPVLRSRRTGGRASCQADHQRRGPGQATAGTGRPDTPYLAQHLDLEGRGEPSRPVRDTSESPLAWMARRRDRGRDALIDAACFEAGERLRRDMTMGALMPRMGSDWSGVKVDGGGPRDPSAGSDAMLAARQRVRAALSAVGSDLSGLLIDLCGFVKGLEMIEAERRWPARSAKVVIRIALARLAEHYGLEREAVGPSQSRLRLWRDHA